MNNQHFPKLEIEWDNEKRRAMRGVFLLDVQLEEVGHENFLGLA